MSQPTPRRFVIDVHRMHDGVYCTLVLPRYSNRAIARAFGHSARDSKRKAVSRARAILREGVSA